MATGVPMERLGIVEKMRWGEVIIRSGLFWFRTKQNRSYMSYRTYYNLSILAARMKSLSVNPSILCVQIEISAYPHPKQKSG